MYPRLTQLIHLSQLILCYACGKSLKRVGRSKRTHYLSSEFTDFRSQIVTLLPQLPFRGLLTFNDVQKMHMFLLQFLLVLKDFVETRINKALTNVEDSQKVPAGLT